MAGEEIVIKSTPYDSPLSRDPDARRNAWNILQTRERIAYAALCKIRTEMNALLPISLLPVEVLCEVFALAAAADPMSVSRRLPRASGWIVLSYVCRSWRETALGCPTLWTAVPLNGGKDWLATFLDRSRAAAIDVTASAMNLQRRAILTVLPEHLHRVRKISVYVDSQDILDALSSPAPRLEHLDLACFVHGPAPLSFPDLFAGHAPRLATVALSESPAFPAHPTLYANVSKFTVHRSLLDPNTFRVPSVSAFFSTLQSMSRITDLQLNGCLPAMSGPPWPEHALHLPHLSHLELVGPIAHVSGVLHQIRLARACTLRVLCEMSDDPSTDAHDVPALVRALHQTGFFGSSAHKPGDAFVVRALSLSSYVEDRLDVSAWRTPCCADDCSALLSHKDAQLSLDFEWPETVTPAAHERRHSAVAAFVCRALPLAALEVLLVESLWFGWSADKWRTLFGRCANVRSVHSGHVDAIALLHALLPPSAPGPPSDGGASEVLFPSLSSVSVFHADFSGLATGGSAEAARDWLRRLFEARRAMGHPVAKLLVGKNDSTRDWAAGLRDVASVLWLHEVLAMGRDTLFTSTDWQAYDWDQDGHWD